MISRSEKNKKKHQERDREIRRKKSKKIWKIFIIFFLIFASLFTSLFLYSMYLEPSMLLVKEELIVNEKLPDSFDGFKIVHFSDTHFGSTVDIDYLRDVVKEINLRKPDMVVFTGDLIDKDTNISLEEESDLIEVLSNIESVVGKYAVKGNHDYSGDRFEMIMIDAGFKTLNNSNELVYYNSNEPILLTGLVSSIKDHVDINNAFNYFTTEGSNQNIYTVSIFHEPDSLDTILSSYPTDLALAGHSHGGQIRLPFMGGIKKVNGAKKYYDEYYSVGNTDLFISYGLGTSTYDLRFLAPPSFNLYRLTK